MDVLVKLPDFSSRENAKAKFAIIFASKAIILNMNLGTSCWNDMMELF